MDDWKPEDPALLDFDLNECTTREFFEVFEMEPSLAGNLQEYRAEVAHIFKFEQLLKLKGVSPETLRQWREPQGGGFDQELQRTLSLPADAPEPLPKLFDGMGRHTGAVVCLMGRYGGILLQSTPENSAPAFPLKSLPDFIRSLQNDMLQMNLGTAGFQVVGFESGDLLFLPAGAFYLAALRPQWELTPVLIQTWRSFAAEVRRRHPPRLCLNNYAPVTENDVVFNCPRCNLRLVVDRAGAGYTFPCPRCKNSATVPGEAPGGETAAGAPPEAAPSETPSA